MTTSQAILVSNELKQLGLNTQILVGSIVKVSLNRKVGRMEIQDALDQTFEGIEFSVQRNGWGVIVE